MPIIPSTTNAPYDSVTTVLNLARTIVNDTAGPNGLAGDLLSDARPATTVYLNSAWQWLQDELLDHGVELFSREAVITGVPAVGSVDPSVETWMDWTQFSNGVTTFDNPVLPQDMILPSQVWQRPTGNGPFYRVSPFEGNQPSMRQGGVLSWWEWRGDKLYMSGSTQTLDLKVRYSSYYADLEIGTDNLVPIVRCKRALAYRIAFEYTLSKGGTAIPMLEASADAEVLKITNRTAARKQQIVYRRQSRH